MCKIHHKKNGGTGPARRRKLWEIKDCYHCSLIGTCLSLDELRKLYARGGGSASALTDYQIHTFFVGLAKDPSPLTRRLHKTLERKFAPSVRRFSGVQTPEDLAVAWDQALVLGDVVGPYWALMTHPALTDALIGRAFADIHMLSHLSGASNRAELKRLESLKRESAALRETVARQEAALQRLREDCQRTRETLDDSRVMLAERERRLEAQDRRLTALENGQAVRRLKDRIETLEQQSQTVERQVAQCWAERLEAVEAQNHALKAALTEREQECQAMEQQLCALLPVPCEDGCPEMNLAGQCILYVGGRTHLIGHLRGLVERCNGRLLHHDGGVEETSLRLHSLLGQADRILCPLDCVSHGAMERIKRFCKQHAKPLTLLRSGGLSSFARALQASTRASVDSGSPAN